MDAKIVVHCEKQVSMFQRKFKTANEAWQNVVGYLAAMTDVGALTEEDASIIREAMAVKFW